MTLPFKKLNYFLIRWRKVEIDDNAFIKQVIILCQLHARKELKVGLTSFWQMELLYVNFYLSDKQERQTDKQER